MGSYLAGKKGEKGEGFDVLKSGDARVAMIGFPSVGKYDGVVSPNPTKKMVRGNC